MPGYGRSLRVAIRSPESRESLNRDSPECAAKGFYVSTFVDFEANSIPPGRECCSDSPGAIPVRSIEGAEQSKGIGDEPGSVSRLGGSPFRGAEDGEPGWVSSQLVPCCGSQAFVRSMSAVSLFRARRASSSSCASI